MYSSLLQLVSEGSTQVLATEQMCRCSRREPKSISRNLDDFSSPHLTPSPEAYDVPGGVAGVVLYVRIPRGGVLSAG